MELVSYKVEKSIQNIDPIQLFLVPIFNDRGAFNSYLFSHFAANCKKFRFFHTSIAATCSSVH